MVEVRKSVFVLPQPRFLGRRQFRWRALFGVLVAALLVAGSAEARKKPAAKSQDGSGEAKAEPKVEPALLGSMQWREVGPYRGGRSAAVAGLPGNRDVYYFGATGGGVWKTGDAGRSWANVSDGFFGGSIGAVEVSAWDPNMVYVGTGEKTVRGNVSHGDGLWGSTDAGKTWKHLGLAESRHISRIRTHPKNGHEVFACAMGHLFGPNEERGVFHSTDGGDSWEKILFVNPQAGCVDLAMDPSNSRILYAAFWRVLRTPWSLESGGEGSTLWKTTDGGATWQELTDNPGLPSGTRGISGITVSPSNPDNLYAIVESEKGGVFRSTDGGATWARTNESRDLRQRAWYYSRIYADPADEESVYVLNVRFHHSKDGGKSFQTSSTPHGDNHDLWIDPNDPQRMIQSNDGGANVSEDGGSTWTTQANQPTAQMYRVSTDNAFPYRLLGGQQDNSSVRIRSRSFSGSGSIGARDWQPSAGCECGHIVAKPDDPDIVIGGCYGGSLEMFNHRTGESRMISVWPDDPMGWGAAELKYRFQWNFPTFFSPHDPDRLYTAAQVLFVSTDLGETWQAISPDLTRNDKDKQGSSGGPITKDNTSVEYYATIFAALESPHEEGVLWAGSDDGLIHLSRDGGENWTDVTPSMLPIDTQINSIEAHPTEKGGLYVAATRYKLDDFHPYLLRTLDYGVTWTRIDSGIPRDHFSRVIRADPDREGLLYAGTERGVYASFDDGGSWQPLQMNLPIAPVTDLQVKEHDLIVATQGRGFWILDDLSVLHQIPLSTNKTAEGAETAPDEPRLWAPRPAYRLPGGFFGRGGGVAGSDPPNGVVLHYYLPEDLDEETEIELEIVDSAGEVIRTLTPKPDPEASSSDEPDEGADEADAVLEASPGAQRWVWDMRYPGAEDFPGMVIWNRFLIGPKAVPGDYQARLTVGDWTAEVPIEILQDPRSGSSLADIQAQFDFLIEARDKLTETHTAIGEIRDIRGQIDSMLGRVKGDGEAAEQVRSEAEALKEKLEGVEEVLYQTQNRSPQDPLNFPIRANDKLSATILGGSSGDFRPTANLVKVRDELVAHIDEQLEALKSIWQVDLPALEQKVREAGIPAFARPETEPES